MSTPTPPEIENFLNLLKERFDANMKRHDHVSWKQVEDKLRGNPDRLEIVYRMEWTGGEPDVLMFEDFKDAITFVDCSTESPQGRRSLCYDRAALEARKEAKPKNSAMDLANEIGIELLDETQYRLLQSYGDFDLKTSSWLKTPDAIRQLKGAIFGDKRYNQTFIYHNGAESYYAARGFRGYVNL